jgi:hypothetical protein
MIADEIKQRLNEIDKMFIEESTESFILEETEKEGKAKIILSLSNYSLLCKNIDKQHFEWLKQKRCADYIIMEKKNEEWVLHIFEFKKTITKEKWVMDIYEQFKGAYPRALSIAGFLKINICKVIVYSCYRDEEMTEKKITNSNINTNFIRLLIDDKRKRDVLGYWHKDNLVLNIFEGIECDNKKIKLDNNGDADVCL